MQQIFNHLLFCCWLLQRLVTADDHHWIPAREEKRRVYRWVCMQLYYLVEGPGCSLLVIRATAAQVRVAAILVWGPALLSTALCRYISSAQAQILSGRGGIRSEQVPRHISLKSWADRSQGSGQAGDSCTDSELSKSFCIYSVHAITYNPAPWYPASAPYHGDHCNCDYHLHTLSNDACFLGE